ncbi:50S ribosomal protein L24 [Candidatus Wolfebacteria bacterium]|nr:MAG: 50S ribosomal protein L24 [Candidatus Wolfebacteria bacterium]
MNFKVNDNVIVISGKDKGKKGKITKVVNELNRVVVDGVNMKKKHQKARRGGESGQVFDIALPLNASNVMLIDPKSGTQTRIAKKVVGDKKIRVSVKSGQEI